MTALDWRGSLACRVGLHAYAPDTDAGYPYQTCRRCGKLGIYRPAPPVRLRLDALLP